MLLKVMSWNKISIIIALLVIFVIGFGATKIDSIRYKYMRPPETVSVILKIDRINGEIYAIRPFRTGQDRVEKVISKSDLKRAK